MHILTIFLFAFCSIILCLKHDKEWNLIDELNRNFTASSCGRIVSGEPVMFGKKPFQIALFYREKFICGGSLISQKHVLTAAHCVIGKQANDLKIHYGAIHHSKGIANFIDYIEIHPKYDAEDNLNDIAMLRLHDTVRTFRNVKRIQLNFDDINNNYNNNNNNNNNSQNIVQVSGWGRVGPFLPVSDKLLVTNLTLIEREECSKRWKAIPKVRINEGILCAADSGSKSACRGDSGGPLTEILNGVETLIGIVSLGASNCYSADLPNIFTNVFHYREWIGEFLQ